jgi:hypothetical protein
MEPLRTMHSPFLVPQLSMHHVPTSTKKALVITTENKTPFPHEITILHENGGLATAQFRAQPSVYDTTVYRDHMPSVFPTAPETLNQLFTTYAQQHKTTELIPALARRPQITVQHVVSATLNTLDRTRPKFTICQIMSSKEDLAIMNEFVYHHKLPKTCL